MTPRLFIEAMRREIYKRGGALHSIEHGGKHLRVNWSLGPSEFVEILPATPSDHRWADNAMSHVKRRLKRAVEERRAKRVTGVK
jgi:hypothetical protein